MVRGSHSHVQLVVAASDSDTDKQQEMHVAAAATNTIRKLKERIEETDGIPAITRDYNSLIWIIQEHEQFEWKKLRILVPSQCETKKFPVEVNPSENVGELRKELERLKEQWQLELLDDGYFFIYKQNVMDNALEPRVFARNWGGMWNHSPQPDKETPSLARAWATRFADRLAKLKTTSCIKDAAS
ncbi:PREDICTED: uncharacterized protein LOC109163792 [Ipomoea nil]|uniref:uncharacterized protein LOC109163792 n=1 Tax=Ipomoea nil TaxID=35883 RepID=UPI0009011295|nr:PREDICTED: uncharacterized protein LOC109163792 [Ipomoea nil]